MFNEPEKIVIYLFLNAILYLSLNFQNSLLVKIFFTVVQIMGKNYNNVKFNIFSFSKIVKVFEFWKNLRKL